MKVRALEIFAAMLACCAVDLALAAPQEALLYDGKMNPACVWEVETGTNGALRPISVVTDFGGERAVGGVRILSPRSWVNCCVRKASFYALKGCGVPVALAEHVSFRPANTCSELSVSWPRTACRQVKMVIEDTWDRVGGYYDWVTMPALQDGSYVASLGGLRYDVWAGPRKTVQIAELEYREEVGRPLAKRPGEGYPQARLERDWLYQSCAPGGNTGLVANTTADTTRPDRAGRDLSAMADASGRVKDTGWLEKREAERRAFLVPFRKRFTQFVYVTHNVMGNSIMHATDDLSDASYLEWRFLPEYLQTPSRLVLATLHEDGSVTEETLLSEPTGVIRDPNLSFDGRKLVFAKRRSLTADDYHLWTYDLETRQARQITFNGRVPKEAVPGQREDVEVRCSDIEPCWLPDGSIVFQSTRCGHNVDCWPLPVSNLHRCDADGRNIRRIGFDQVQTFYPQVLTDGRVSYTRWEYNDRQTGYIQKLCAMNPDGTRQTGLFGNNSEFPVSLLHARAIPGTGRLLATSSGHHTGQKGKLVELDLSQHDYDASTYDSSKAVYGISTNGFTYTFPGNRRIELKPSPWDAVCGATATNVPGVRYVAGGSPDGAPGTVPVRAPKFYNQLLFDGHAQIGPQWAYPHPVDAEGDVGRFLVSFLPEGSRFQRGPFSAWMGVYAMDGTGRRELLAYEDGHHAMQAVPVMPRKVRRLVNRRLGYAKGFGTYYVQNVYAGAAMEGAPTGSVARLRVVAMEFRPAHIGWNWQYGCHSHTGKIGTPISVGNGAYDVKHVLGEAEVEADGSCYFTCPARTPVFFQAVDADGCVIQTMRSWSTLMPGEANSCVGCHERPSDAASPVRAIALSKGPQRLKPWKGGTEHPLLARLEREGPLASLDNFMGVNRIKPVENTDAGEGFSFRRSVQPFLSAKCISCHGGAAGRPDFRDERPSGLPDSDLKAMRKFTRAYLALSCAGACCENVNFAHAQSFAPFRPPYSFGATKSKWYRMLAAGHPDASGRPRVRLSDGERRTLALWIDLCVPFCGTYSEEHDWDDWHVRRYVFAQNRRAAFAWLELNELRAEMGLPPVPLTGFVANVDEPRKQVRWDE